MNRKHIYTRIGFLTISLLLVLVLLAVSMPQTVQAAITPGKFDAWVQNGKIYVRNSDYSTNQQVRVKVRDAGQGVGGWKLLGKIKIPKKTTQTNIFPIPKALAKTVYLNVCQKNMFTNKLTCKVVVNPGY
jgi:hypothetical protein